MDTILEIPVIFEDQWLFALNKPAGIHSVGAGVTVASYAAQRWPEVGGLGRRSDDNGLVQRLDFETSGIILGAKNKATLEKLCRAMENDDLSKRYRIVVEGLVVSSFTIDSQLGNRHRGSKRVSVYPSDIKVPRSQQAHTDFSVVTTLPNVDCTILDAHASAARRHQVRAHAAHRGRPLIGDHLYGAKRTVAELLGDITAPQFLLHAIELSLKHPETGAQLELRAPLPAYWGSLNPTEDYLPR